MRSGKDLGSPFARALENFNQLREKVGVRRGFWSGEEDNKKLSQGPWAKLGGGKITPKQSKMREIIGMGDMLGMQDTQGKERPKSWKRGETFACLVDISLAIATSSHCCPKTLLN